MVMSEGKRGFPVLFSARKMASGRLVSGGGGSGKPAGTLVHLLGQGQLMERGLAVRPGNPGPSHCRCSGADCKSALLLPARGAPGPQHKTRPPTDGRTGLGLVGRISGPEGGTAGIGHGEGLHFITAAVGDNPPAGADFAGEGRLLYPELDPLREGRDT